MPFDPFDYAEPAAELEHKAKGTAAPVTAGEVFRAGRTLQEVDNSNWQDRIFDEEFGKVLEAVNDQRRAEGLSAIMPPSLGYLPGGSTADLARAGNAYAAAGSLQRGDRREVARAILVEAARIRESNPAFLPGIGTDVDAYLAPRLEREKQRRGEAGDVMRRSSGFVQGTAGFAGGMTKAMEDPVNIATLPLGGGTITASRSVLVQAFQRSLTSGLAGGTVELFLQPEAARNRELIGEELTLAEGVQNVLFAFGGAFLFQGAVEGGVHAGAKLIDRLTPLDRKLARALEAADPAPASQLEAFAQVLVREDPELLGDIVRQANGGELAPDEESALAMLQREAEAQAMNPYEPIGAGRAQYEDELTRSIDEVLSGVRREVPDPRDIPMPETREATETVTPEAPARAASSSAGLVYDREAVKARIRGPESGGNDQATNGLGSSASGRYQFIEGTFKEYYRKVYGASEAEAERVWNSKRRFDPEIQERLMDAFTDNNARILQRAGMDLSTGNLYLAHFAGAGRAVKLLQAAPDAPVSRFFTAEEIAQNPSYLGGGKSVSQAIAAVHNAVGGRAAAVPAGGGAVEGGNAAAVLRDEALQLRREAAEIDGLGPVEYERFDPDEIEVDAELMQFKSGGDEFGVTDRLRGVKQWNPLLAGRVVVWEAADGRRLIADGHQRRGLAARIKAEDPTQRPMLDALVLREAEGWDAETVRTWAALKNIAEGSGSAVDAAKVMRGIPREDWDKYLPPKSALVRDAEGLVRLGDDAFGMVVNEIVDPAHAAIVGRMLADPGEQKAMVDLLAKLAPRTIGEADGIVRQGMAAGFARETQEDMFGALDVTTSLFVERARVLDRGLAELRKMRQAFGSAARNADTLEKAGNRINKAASEKEVQDNAQAVELVRRSAWSAGPVKDAIDAGAEQLAAGGKLSDIVTEFVARVRDIELSELARLAGSGEGAAGRGGVDGSGRASDADAPDQALRASDGDPAEPRLTPEGDPVDPIDGAWPSREDLEAAGQGGFDLGDELGAKFDEPAGEGQKIQLESLEHDARLAHDPFEGLDDLMAKAEANQLELAAFGQAQAGGGIEFKDPGIKSVERVREKVMLEGYESAAELKDITRGALVVNTESAAERMAVRVLEQFDVVQDKGWKRLPTGYVDRKFIVRFANGGIGELQIVPRQVWDAKKGGANELYEEMRATDDPARALELEAQMREIYEAAVAGSRFADIAERSTSGNSAANSSGVSLDPSANDLPTSAGVNRQREPDMTQARPLADVSTATGRPSSSNNSSFTENAPQSGNVEDFTAVPQNAQVDPAVADRQRQELALRAAAPMQGANRTGQAQDGTMGLGLFDTADQPQFALERGNLFTIDGEDRSLGDMLDEAAADRAGLEAARKCL